MEYMQLGEYAIASLELFGVAHNHVDTYSEIQWSSSDQKMLSCVASTANPGYADLRALQVGTVKLNGVGKYDTGKGIAPWTHSVDIKIIDGVVATAEIHILHGEVVPIGGR